MGRPAVKPEEMQLIDNTHFKGRWMNRNDIWKKVALPQKTIRYIVDACKSKNMPADIQQDIKQYMFQ
jgi:hypothetical protein